MHNPLTATCQGCILYGVSGIHAEDTVSSARLKLIRCTPSRFSTLNMRRKNTRRFTQHHLSLIISASSITRLQSSAQALLVMKKANSPSSWGSQRPFQYSHVNSFDRPTPPRNLPTPSTPRKNSRLDLKRYAMHHTKIIMHARRRSCRAEASHRADKAKRSRKASSNTSCASTT